VNLVLEKSESVGDVSRESGIISLLDKVDEVLERFIRGNKVGNDPLR
jgi:hypothetical protein